ncbi:ATP-binding protein [Pseudomonas sp. 21LCFQ010]|uniref:ATP-binding protein n=1 Tax=Pseudomonas sp. 21LCFQ010 TaxID=2957506 RepID=UPI0025B796F7|nr:ATP-binding protein [Pseudomonas sp. 21LCFQ010]
MGNQACRQGMHTTYRTASKLFEDIALSYVDHSFPKLRRQFIRAELLIIDDLGIGGIDDQLGRFLLDVIDQQSQSGALLVKSMQLPTCVSPIKMLIYNS